MAGLDPRHKGSQPRVADAKLQARIARKTHQKPGDGSTHWSCRKLAQALGLSKSTVQRVWTQMRLKPHRLDRYMASNDPRFEEKAADIIALYMNPPQHAAVFCVDEKTAIQALDRLDPVLPLSPGRAERRVVALQRTAPGGVVPDNVVVYLNRLSDLLFMMARRCTVLQGAPRRNRPPAQCAAAGRQV
jgi:hypothetical protein